MTRKAAYAGFSYLAGMLAASFLSSILSVSAGFLFLCLGICIYAFFGSSLSQRLRKTAFCSVAFAAGALLYCGYDVIICQRIIAHENQPFYGEVQIISSSVYSEDNAFYTARCTFPDGTHGKTGFYSTDSSLIRGDRIELSGKLYIPSDDGFFNSESYYRTMNVFLLLKNVKEGRKTQLENNPFRIINEYRQRTSSLIRKYVTGDEAELIIGMLFGNRCWNMSHQTEQMLYRSGIGHIAAVSGMHMAVAAGIAAAVLTAAGCPKHMKFIATALVCGLFAMTADFTPSVVRSYIMIMLVYTASLFNRQSDPLSSLGTAIILLTAASPFSVRNPSFLLSVSGVLGTAVFAPAMVEAIEQRINIKRRKKGKEDYTAGAFVTSAAAAVCAGAAVFPASAALFDEISVISPLTNLLLSPLCTAVLTISFAGAAVCLIFGGIGGGLFLAAGVICRFVLKAAAFFSSLSGASIPSGLEILPPIIIITVSAAVICCLLTDDVFSTSAVLAASVFISICAVHIFSIYPSDTEITVLTEGNGCIVLVKNNSCTQLYDFMGSSRGAEKAMRNIRRSGAENAGLIMLSRKCEYMRSVYEELFPSFTITDPVSKSGLTYSEEDTIIKFGNTRIYPCNGYTVIETDGAEIIVVNKKCTVPDKQYDLCIYNTQSDVTVDALAYISADEDFHGSIPAGIPCTVCVSADYTVSGGKIAPKEEIAWLR